MVCCHLVRDPGFRKSTIGDNCLLWSCLPCGGGQILSLHQEEKALTVPKLGDVSGVLSFLLPPLGLMSWHGP